MGNSRKNSSILHDTIDIFLNINKTQEEQQLSSEGKAHEPIENKVENINLKIDQEVKQIFKKNKIAQVKKQLNFMKILQFGSLTFSVFIIFFMLSFWYVNYTKYQKVFENNVKINSLDVGNKNLTQATNIIQNSVADKSLKIKLPDGNIRHLGYYRAGGYVTPTNDIKKFLNQQNPALWFLRNETNFVYKPFFLFPKKESQKEIAHVIEMHLPEIDIKKALNYNQKEKQFFITKLMNNKVFPKAILVNDVFEKLKNNAKFIDLSKSGTNSILLRNLKNKANHLLLAKQILKIGKFLIQIPKDEIAKWVEITTNKIKIKQHLIRDYVNMILKQKNTDQNRKYYYDLELLTKNISTNTLQGGENVYVALSSINKSKVTVSKVKTSKISVNSKINKNTKKITLTKTTQKNVKVAPKSNLIKKITKSAKTKTVPTQNFTSRQGSASSYAAHTTSVKPEAVYTPHQSYSTYESYSYPRPVYNGYNYGDYMDFDTPSYYAQQQYYSHHIFSNHGWNNYHAWNH